MLDKAAVEGFLKAFADEVVAKSKQRANKSTSKGAESIDYDLEVFKRSFSLNFEMAAYMYFQDRGVAGIKSGRSLSGFAYTDKMPPARAFDGWVIRKGLAPRTARGTFTARAGIGNINWMIARSIYLYGIKPKVFFTSSFEEEFENFPEELVDAYALTVEQMMKVELGSKDA